ncbi:unnamed protein product [Rotaria sp. Silwood2]|nr:unnamed protein product [Rotaria sp. Silwood2]CAF4090574.1 unnamed protein product [Rotaria sp. Silwood2]
MGLGIFVQDIETDEVDAEAIANKIRIAVMSAPPFYEYIAKQAIDKSELNVINNNIRLLARFDFLFELYKKENNKYLKSKGKIKRDKTSSITNAIKFVNVEFTNKQQTIWLAISCIDAFFSWTEHLFIHLAIVGQYLSNGNKVTTLMLEDWQTKFKAGIPDTSKDLHSYFNELIAIRQQVRNFIAHGAYGKDGAAFYFHSNTGAVPVKMDYKKGKKKFSLELDLTFNYEDAIKLIQDFINTLENGSLELPMLYTQKYALPTVLSFASNGFYQTAMIDKNSFEACADYISKLFDDAGNMDW